MKVDTLIIGSGIAAAAISQRLLDADPESSILLLEAGGKVKMQDAALWQDYMISGKLPYDRYKDMDYPSQNQPGQNLSVGKTLVPLAGSRVMNYGGSTIHWDGWSFRLQPEDFRLGAVREDCINWPIDYATLEPYYGQAENYIGVSGDSNDKLPPRSTDYPFPAFPFTLEDGLLAGAMESLKIGYSHLPIARHGITDTTSRHAPCKTTGTCLYCPFGARYATTNFLNEMTDWNNYPRFETRINCVVREILMESESKARGVVYYDRLTQEQVTVEANRIIVAGGAIESPKLLLRSKSKHWPNGIGNQHDLVGRNIIWHPYFMFSSQIAHNPRKLQQEMDFATLVSRHYDSPQQQKKGKFVLLNPPNYPDAGIATKMQNGMSREDIDNAITGNTVVQIHGMLEIFSEYQNRVSNLEGKVNQLGLTETVVNFSQPADLHKRIAEIEKHANELFAAMGASPTQQLYLFWLSAHAACTCRMSDDEKLGVTDGNMKIHGVHNVYVCSNAAFSSLGAVNPTLTLTALSFRLADHLLKTTAAGESRHG